MKSFIAPTYTFTPGASGVGTVNLSGISGFNIKYLVAVINQTRGVVIYSTGDAATRYTNLAGTTLTLNVDTSTHNSGDTLQVIYEVTSSDPLTDNQLRASAVPVSAASLPLPSGAATLTEQQLQTTLLGTIDTDSGNIASSASSIDTKTPALVSGRVPVDGSGVTQPVSIAASVAVTGPLTDTQLRATPVPISGTVTANTGLTQPLTDSQLRATAVPVSGPLTDTQLRSTAVPVSAASLPLPSGAATETTLGNVLTTSAFQARVPVNGQATMAASIPVVIASNQSAVPMDWADAQLTTFTQAGVIAINTILMTLDLLNYAGVAIQCTSMGTTGQISPEWSIDNASWLSASLNSQIGAVSSAISGSGLFNLPRQARYLRLRLSTATTGGTTTVYAERYVSMPQYWYATQNVGGSVTTTSSTGTALMGDVGVQYRSNATGAASGAHLVSGATTNATVAKASAGRLLGWSLANTNAAWRYVKLHNQATTPTAGSGVVRTIGIPPNNTSQITFEGGIAFSTGIAFTTVTGAADADTTAVGANDIVGDLYYA